MTLALPNQEELSSYQYMAKMAASSPHWRKLGGNGSPEEVIATILSVILMGRELGFSPLQVINGGINNIQGKFEMSARLMNMAIRRNGHKMAVRILNNDICTLWARRRDTGEEMEVSYLYEEAVRSGLVRDGGPWKKVPQDMLFARALSRLARRLFPDCIGGCYVEGEYQEIVSKGTVDVDVTPPQDLGFYKSEEVVLNVPEAISKDHLNLFLEETASQWNKSVLDVKRRASENLNGFLSKFSEWEQSRFPVEEKDLVAV